MGESEAESGDDGGDVTDAGEGGKEKTKQEIRAEKKKKLKEMFNADYDDGKGMLLFVLSSNFFFNFVLQQFLF